MAAALLVVRHAVAVDRDDWPDDDDDRPLSPAGERQAVALSAWLRRQPAAVHGRLLSSPSRRCLATLEPYALRSGLPIEGCEALRPGREAEASAVAGQLLSAGGGVLCTHGEVLPGLLTALAAELDGPAPADSEKGSVWILRPAAGPRSAAAASVAAPRNPAATGSPARAGVDEPRLQGHYVGPGRLAHTATG